MFESSNEIAVAIPLKVWKNPQGNPLLINSEHSCEVFVGCWNELGDPADYICKISFAFAWATRTFGIEFLPYEIKKDLPSPIYEVVNSNWLKESSDYRLTCYPAWKDWEKKTYHHYIIRGHDNFVEVLAESYDEKTILIEEAKNILPSNYLDYFNQ